MLEARVLSLRQFLGESFVQYVIPAFQRGYSWDTSAWAMLWGDLIQQSEHPDVDRTHFYGVFVCVPIEDSPIPGPHKWLVIDGYQRLLTASILLSAIRLAMLSDDQDEPMAKMIDGLLIAPPWLPKDNLETKILPIERERESFIRLVLGQAPDRSQIGRAFSYFEGQLLGIDCNHLELRQLAQIFLERFTLVRVQLAPDEDPLPIVTYLNTSSLPLSEDQITPYRKFKGHPRLMALIAGGESRTTEFKQAAYRDPFSGQRNDRMRDQIVRTVAAFMNMKAGGNLLIGITDDGSIVGIEGEYSVANASKANWDSYMLSLTDILKSHLSVSNPFLFCEIMRVNHMGHDVCWLRVRPSPDPVYVNKRLYVRDGSRSVELQGPDLISYVHDRWPLLSKVDTIRGNSA